MNIFEIIYIYIYIYISKPSSSWHKDPKTLVIKGAKRSFVLIFCLVFDPSPWHRSPKTFVISWVIGMSDTELLNPLEFPVC